MKVLDLQCAQGHGFEGWFASGEDFDNQCARKLVQCPLCGNAEVTKKLSAPRLNLGAGRERSAEVPESAGAQTLAAAWLDFSRKLVANTADVGERFADEARKMHYGDAPERAIRGKTTPDEAQALVEEGIEVMPLLLPEGAGETLQ